MWGFFLAYANFFAKFYSQLITTQHSNFFKKLY